MSDSPHLHKHVRMQHIYGGILNIIFNMHCIILQHSWSSKVWVSSLLTQKTCMTQKWTHFSIWILLTVTFP
jgi:hypothetical protein